MKKRVPRDDWRRQGQEEFLRGLKWSLRFYVPYREGWDHDHCEFCWRKFSLAKGDVHIGYVSGDKYHWVCEECFADFCDELGWQVE